MNDTNPYAPPVPVEEDAPGFDLRKIARLYNRLRVVLKWFVLLFAIWIPAIVGLGVLEWNEYHDYVLPPILMITIKIFTTYLFYPTSYALIITGYYSMFATVLNVFTLKYRGPFARPLIILGAISFPITIFIMALMRRRAAQILRDNGIEIINGKVDMTQIPVEEDY